MMTAALQRAERTPPNDRGFQGRIESERDDAPGDFSDYLKSSKGKSARSSSHATSGTTEPDPAGATTPQGPTMGDTSSLASLLLIAMQVPIAPPAPSAPEPSLAGNGEADDKAGDGITKTGDETTGGSLPDSVGVDADSQSSGSVNAASPEKGQAKLKEDKQVVTTKPGLPAGQAKESSSMPSGQTSTSGLDSISSDSPAQAADCPPKSFDPQAQAGADVNGLVPAPALDAAIVSADESKTQVGVGPVDNKASSQICPTGKGNAELQGDEKPEAPSESSGTPAASTEITMHFARSQNGFAGGGKQDLPGRQSSSSELKSELPVGAMGSAGAGGPVGTQPPPLEIPPIQNMTTQAEQVTQRIERIGELLHTECMLMRQVKPASLSAVLRPDTDTEIHIQLRFDRNGIEAVCRCEKGDMQSLQSGWTELQRQLSQQGVRLMPIQVASESAGTTSNWSMGSGGRDASRQEAKDNERQPSFWGLPALASLSPRPAQTGSPVLPGASRHMLESWA